MKDGLTPVRVDQVLAKVRPRQRVAVVDDDPQTHDLVGRALRDEGFEVFHLKKAEELLVRFQEIQPDVIVIEAILPGMSALVLLEELRPARIEESLPVLVISQKEDIRAKLLAFRRGAWDYLVKPFNADELAARVRVLTRSKLLQEVAQLSAVLDPLTSLYNRRFLLVWLEREIHRLKRYHLETSCLLLDVDGLSAMNAAHGEEVGDYVLKEMAGVMTGNLRASDVLGRFEGDEFLVFLPGTSKDKALVAGRRLKRLVAEKEFSLKGKRLKPTFCMGITGCEPTDTLTSNSLVEKAEEALSKAKSVGVGETAVF